MVASDRGNQLQRAFGAAVRRARIKKGISQEQLADESGLHRTYVSLLERGRRNPSLKVISLLAAALDTNIVSLVSGIEAGAAKGS
jgi:transcriptional regulator with XRE-family HTH domain